MAAPIAHKEPDDSIAEAKTVGFLNENRQLGCGMLADQLIVLNPFSGGKYRDFRKSPHASTFVNTASPAGQGYGTMPNLGYFQIWRQSWRRFFLARIFGEF